MSVRAMSMLANFCEQIITMFRALHRIASQFAGRIARILLLRVACCAKLFVDKTVCRHTMFARIWLPLLFVCNIVRAMFPLVWLCIQMLQCICFCIPGNAGVETVQQDGVSFLFAIACVEAQQPVWQAGVPSSIRIDYDGFVDTGMWYRAIDVFPSTPIWSKTRSRSYEESASPGIQKWCAACDAWWRSATCLCKLDLVMLAISTSRVFEQAWVPRPLSGLSMVARSSTCIFYK